MNDAKAFGVGAVEYLGRVPHTCGKQPDKQAKKKQYIEEFYREYCQAHGEPQGQTNEALAMLGALATEIEQIRDARAGRAIICLEQALKLLKKKK